MKKETVLIAAYGTLRSGERNERFCRNAISRRSATISGTLYDTGWGFPAFVPKGKMKVSVELIEIPIRDWADVDRLEGYPRLYDRVLTDFRLPDGSDAAGLIFVFSYVIMRVDGSRPRVFVRAYDEHIFHII